MTERLVNNELESFWMEVVMVYFEVLFWHLSGGTEEKHEEF
jgi:hypothetical protein